MLMHPRLPLQRVFSKTRGEEGRRVRQSDSLAGGYSGPTISQAARAAGASWTSVRLSLYSHSLIAVINRGDDAHARARPY